MDDHQRADFVSAQLPTVGVAAHLPGELPQDRVIEIADALLAAPLLAVEIIPNGPNTLDTLRTIRQRAGREMLVGAGRVESRAQLHAVMEAGAQFASSAADFKLPLMAEAKQLAFLYLPTVHAPAQALLARRAGATWQKIRDDVDVDSLEAIRERMPSGAHLIGNQIETEWLDACYESGLALAFVNDIYLGPNQSMGDIITRARTARRVWLAHSAETPPPTG